MIRENRLEPLLALRALACIFVVFAHVKGNFPSDNFFVLFGWDLTWTISVTGAFGVWVFFVLSGYLMGKGFFSGRYESTVASTRKFYWNRFLRIYPLYLFSIIVTCIAFRETYPLVGQNLKTIFDLMTFSYYGRTGFPDSVLWTISTEFRFYLLVPFVFLLVRRFATAPKALCAVATLIVLSATAYRLWVFLHYHHQDTWMTSWIWYAYIPLIGNFDLFILGFLLGAVLENYRSAAPRLSFAPWMGWLIFATVYILYAYVSYGGLIKSHAFLSPIFFIGTPSLVGIGLCVTIACFELKSSAPPLPLNVNTLLAKPIRMLEIFGIITFGMYVWHILILAEVRKVDLPFSSPYTLFFAQLLIVFAASTAVATITYLLVERPFQRLRPLRFWPRKRSPSEGIRESSN